MTFVTPEHIRKTMEKHYRCIFYVYDDKKGLLHASEDCNTPAAAYSELEDYLEGCLGSHVIVELPATAKGQGRRGGNKMTSDDAKFEFKVRLQSGNNGRNDIAGGSNLSLIMSLMEKQNQLSRELLAKDHEHKLSQIERDMQELKKKKEKDGNFDKLIDHFLNKMDEAERVKGIARDVTAKHKPQPEQEPAGTMAEEVKPNPMKEKLKGAINTFKEVDENYIDNMAFLAEYAKKNPEIYKEFIAGLKGAEV